jgi:hypothetical protein
MRRMEVGAGGAASGEDRKLAGADGQHGDRLAASCVSQ